MYADDLLAQARLLIGLNPGAEKQADLRRAVSSAYYAFFHFFIQEATEQFVGTTPATATARLVLSRAFKHGTMSQACRCFSSEQERKRKPVPAAGAAPGGGPPISPTSAPLAPAERQAEIPAVGPVKIPGGLQVIADAFLHLLEARSRADYDLSAPFSKLEATELVTEAERAIASWIALFRGKEMGQLFLTVLLTYDDLSKHAK
jgi:hypothetical protein